MGSEVSLCLCANAAYLKFASITLISSAVSLRHGASLKAHVISGDPIPLPLKDALRESAPSAEVDFIDPSSEKLVGLAEEFRRKCGFKPSPTWLRIFIPELFPDLDKLIYLDCDLSVSGDLASLLEVRLEDKPIGAVRDPGIAAWRRGMPSRSERKLYKDRDEYLTRILGMDDPSSYFNAGVLLLSPRKLHEDGFLGMALDWLSENPSLRYLDQDLLNHFFSSSCISLDPRWNVLMGFALENHDAASDPMYAWHFRSREDPWCCHYAGPFKPWLTPNEELALAWTRHVHESKFCWQLEALRHEGELGLVEQALRSDSLLRLSVGARLALLKLLSSMGLGRGDAEARRRQLKRLWAFLRNGDK